MSHHELRKEKDCLNCGSIVEDRFCPHCGQENKVNRPRFHYLFTHFFEDLTHYESSFWKTLKYLFLKPGLVVNEFLSGKRKKYINPIRLYIFVSFITFFIPFILPKFNDSSETEKVATKKIEGIEYAGHKNIQTANELDSIFQKLPAAERDTFKYNIIKTTLLGIEEKSDTARKGLRVNIFGEKDYKTIEELDAAYKHKSGPINWVKYKLIKKKFSIKNDDKLGEKFLDIFLHNLSKVLFVYLPIFAFILWLFHNKKRWFYYDHGIFTLYYFSLLLLMITILVVLNWMFNLLGDNMFLGSILGLLFFGSFFYAFFYFFKSHRLVYKEKKWVSRLKSFAIFFINLFVVVFLITFYVLYVYMKL